MIVELVITALFTIGVVYFMSGEEQKVWVLEKDGEEWKPILKYKKNLTKGEEYSTYYSSAFKGAKRRKYWSCENCKIFK